MESKDGGPVYPCFVPASGETGGMFHFGITKREWFAGMIIQGMLANPNVMNENGLFNMRNFRTAFECAESMIKSGK